MTAHNSAWSVSRSIRTCVAVESPIGWCRCESASKYHSLSSDSSMRPNKRATTDARRQSTGPSTWDDTHVRTVRSAYTVPTSMLEHKARPPYCRRHSARTRSPASLASCPESHHQPPRQAPDTRARAHCARRASQRIHTKPTAARPPTTTAAPTVATGISGSDPAPSHTAAVHI